MMPHEPARVCTDCTPHHIENCPDCYGFGVYTLSGTPVRAGDCDNVSRQPQMQRCPTCRSDYRGVISLND